MLNISFQRLGVGCYLNKMCEQVVNTGIWSRRGLSLVKHGRRLLKEIPHVNEWWAGKKKCTKGQVKIIPNI